MPWVKLDQPTKAEAAAARKDQKRARLLVDESLLSITERLRASGWNVADVNSLGLVGRDDEDIVKAAHGEGRYIVTADKDFLREGRLPPNSKAAVVILLHAHTDEQKWKALNCALGSVAWGRELFSRAIVTVTPDGVVTIKNPEGDRTRYRIRELGPNQI
jgi:predicted nuclease of predicted toxin-antitoxin system